MDPCLSHEILTHLLNISTPPVWKVNLRTCPRGRACDAGKRYATYFPSKASFLNTEWNIADDKSTWEFLTPVSPMARNFSKASCNPVSTTAAQEIALQVRAGMPLKAVLSGLSSVSISSEELDRTSWKTAPGNTLAVSASEVPPPVPEKDHQVRARCNSLRDKELSASLQEALNTMKRDGRNEHDPLVCHRPGCRDVVRNVEAFMYHLHIHNVHDETLKCSSCYKQFSYGFQLSLHHCSQESRLRFPSRSPLKGCLFHVLNRMASCFN